MRVIVGTKEQLEAQARKRLGEDFQKYIDEIQPALLKELPDGGLAYDGDHPAWVEAIRKYRGEEAASQDEKLRKVLASPGVHKPKVSALGKARARLMMTPIIVADAATIARRREICLGCAARKMEGGELRGCSADCCGMKPLLQRIAIEHRTWSMYYPHEIALCPQDKWPKLFANPVSEPPPA